MFQIAWVDHQQISGSLISHTILKGYELFALACHPTSADGVYMCGRDQSSGITFCVHQFLKHAQKKKKKKQSHDHLSTLTS